MPRPKQRPLTEILKRSGEQKKLDSLGRKRLKNEILADMMWEFATDGRVTFTTGRVLEASVRDWRDCASWLYNHTDGPAKSDITLDLSGVERELQEASIDDLKATIASLGPDLAAAFGYNEDTKAPAENVDTPKTTAPVASSGDGSPPNA